MQDQLGWRALERRLREEAPFLLSALPQLPRLIYQRLSAPPPASEAALKDLAAAQRSRSIWLTLVAAIVGAAVVLIVQRWAGA